MEHLLAQADYQMLAPIPQLLKAGSSETTTVNAFIEGIVPLIIGVAGGLAVLRIIIGGIQYMSTDAWGGKKEAKGTITNAIVGLLLVIGAYTLLNTINPALVNFNLEIKGLEVCENPETCDIDSNAGGNSAKSASELGCDNCDVLSSAEINIRPGACANSPCYAKEGLLMIVNVSMMPALKNSDTASSTWRATQVVRAFPSPSTSEQFSDPCFQPSKPNSGSCIDFGLTVNSVDNVKNLLDAAKAAVTMGGGYSYRYNACGSRTIELQNHTKLNDYPNSTFSCFSPSRPEFMQIYIPS